MMTLVIDVAMTRRKLFCFVFDEHKTLLWSGQRVGEALAWLVDQGERVVLCDTGKVVYVLEFFVQVK